MISVENTLFHSDRSAFREIEDQAIIQFHRLSKEQRIRGDIFRILRYKPRMHVIKFPVEDDHFQAFAARMEGEDFIFVNTHAPLNVQIFAAAHELYHVLYDGQYKETGTDLLLDVSSSYNGSLNEMKANGFAACLLAPQDLVESEISLLAINRTSIGVYEVLKLMDAFAMPYEGMVLRLHEVDLLSVEQTTALLGFDKNKLHRLIQQTRHAVYWQKATYDQEFSNLLELAIHNLDHGAIPFDRLERVFALVGESMEEYLDIKKG